MKGLVNKFISVMSEIKIAAHPLKATATVVLMRTVRNLYRDNVSQQELERVDKNVIFIKSTDLDYVQMMEDIVLEDDTDQVPWIVIMTIKDLSRALKNSDQIIINGVDYQVAKVKPVNRELNSVIKCLVFPRRDMQPTDVS